MDSFSPYTKLSLEVTQNGLDFKHESTVPSYFDTQLSNMIVLIFPIRSINSAYFLIHCFSICTTYVKIVLFLLSPKQN